MLCMFGEMQCDCIGNMSSFTVNGEKYSILSIQCSWETLVTSHASPLSNAQLLQNADLRHQNIICALQKHWKPERMMSTVKYGNVHQHSSI